VRAAVSLFHPFGISGARSNKLVPVSVKESLRYDSSNLDTCESVSRARNVIMRVPKLIVVVPEGNKWKKSGDTRQRVLSFNIQQILPPNDYTQYLSLLSIDHFDSL